MVKKVALGKGIASLIEETPNEILKHSLQRAEDDVSEMETLEDGSTCLVDISQIAFNANQPRKIFKEKELEELADSIAENGIIQPLIVAKVENGFELIAGERRLRAATIAGLEKVPVVVKRGTDRDRMVMSIIENVQRMDLNCVEEALAYYKLMEDFNLTQEEVAKRLGKERSSIANYLRILKLPRHVVELLQKEKMSFGHAKVLASLEDRDRIIALADVVARNGISVRELERLSKAKEQRVPRKTPSKASSSYDSLRENLEQSTGFHFAIKGKADGPGKIIINFSDSQEFNNIYDYLLRK